MFGLLTSTTRARFLVCVPEYVTPLLGKYDAYAEQLEKQIETADSTSEANRFKKDWMP